jgi:hypothetical protein
MAAWGTLPSEYTAYRDALLLENGRWLNLLNKEPIPAENGVPTWPITTAVTLAAITDGTPTTNGAAQTHVAGTAFRYIHPFNVAWDQVGQVMKTPDTMLGQIRAAQNAAQATIEALFVAAIVAATPGETDTLPAGQKDFGSDGTAAKQYLAMAKLDAAIGYIEANCGGKPRSQIFILASLAAYKNLKTLKNGTAFDRRFEQQSGQWYIDGIPIYTTTYTTNFGGASKETLYVIHGDGLGLVWKPIFSPSNFEFVQADSGMAQVQIHTYGAYKVLQVGHIAAVDCTTS